MGKYAIIRAKTPPNDKLDRPPAAVFEVERETAATLFGKLLYKDGQPLRRDYNYDRQPETDAFRINQPSAFRMPGQVKASRQIARHCTFEAAAAGLKAAQEAWISAEDRSAYNEASLVFRTALRSLEDERKRLLAEVERQLAPMQVSQDEAKAALWKAKLEMFEKMDAAAARAASSVSTPSPAAPFEGA